ncbi:MAG TPA: hypothetical protein VE258_17660 [Ktedonobacterales bacterium]|nr:hypothetical protein [Ktedonobacterales bacterium]
MSKRTIVILSIGAILLYIGGFVAIGAGAASCVGTGSTATTAANCTAGAGALGLGTILIVVGSILALIAWIFGLIKSAQASAWGWFVLVLLISPLGSLIYGLAGPDSRA